MKIVCSFNKTGVEAEGWKRSITAASTDEHAFIPFDHTPYLDPGLYLEAWQLDRLYRARDRQLMKLYQDFNALVGDTQADAIVVNNCPPYHPEFLRTLEVYRVLNSSDDPDSTYRRNIPYLHAYHHVLFADPVYSADLDMAAKMRYCGMVNADWSPIGVMDYEMDSAASEEEIFASERDIDIIYTGSFFRQKLALLAAVKNAFGPRVRIHGFFRPRHNLYFIAKHGYRSWVRPVSFEERTRLFRQAKIGLNIHWNDYGLGNQRLYQLPANGVMQLSDCADHVHRVFDVGREIDTYRTANELIDKLRFYLRDEQKRVAMARAGYRRTMKEYRFEQILRDAARLIALGMNRVSWTRRA